jgi:hypothetical protein
MKADAHVPLNWMNPPLPMAPLTGPGWFEYATLPFRCFTSIYKEPDETILTLKTSGNDLTTLRGPDEVADRPRMGVRGLKKIQ